MKLIGLTGGTGCGKSEAASILRGLGYEVPDADLICREVVLPGMPAWTDIRRVFGEEVFFSDGTLHRKKLGRIVFSDPEKKEALNRIMYRHVLSETKKRLAECSGEIVFFDAPLLFEYGLDARCAAVISVLAERSVRRARIMVRDGLTEEEAEARINSQNKDEFYLAKSDYIVYNNSTRDALSVQILEITERLREMP